MAIMVVEMGDVGVSQASDARLQACGLGACVGLCLYDSRARLAVLVHIVLPLTLPALSSAPRLAPPGKCADTALPHALAEIVRLGGCLEQIQAALVGGAHIFSAGGTSTNSPSLSRLEIGQRNVLAVKEGLIRAQVPLCAEETGGQGGRTVTLDAATGDVWVRPVGLGERLLISLGWSGTLPGPALSAASPEGVFAYGH